MNKILTPLAVAIVTIVSTTTPYAASSIKVAVDSSFYPTAGRVFTVVPLPTGEVIAPVVPYDKTKDSGQILGIEIFNQTTGSLASKCVSPAPPSLPISQIDGLNLYPGGAYLGAAVYADPGSPRFNGLLMLKTSDVVACNGQSSWQFITQYIDGESQSVGTGDTQFNAAGTFAFVRNEYGGPSSPTGPFGPSNTLKPFVGNVGITRLIKDSSGGFTQASKLISEVSSGGSTIAGLTLSQDGSRLYVSSELAPNSPRYAGSKNKILTKTACVGEPNKPATINGLLTVIDVAKAEAGLGEQAVISRVNAACTPTRIIESLDGEVIWVAARSSNQILGFSKQLLETDPDHALIGYSKSYGKAPVGLGLLNNGSMLAVANSNRYDSSTKALGNLTILDIRNPKHPTLVKSLPAGQFPRDINISSDGLTIYLANYGNNGPTPLNTGIGVYKVTVLKQ